MFGGSQWEACSFPGFPDEWVIVEIVQILKLQISKIRISYWGKARFLKILLHLFSLCLLHLTSRTCVGWFRLQPGLSGLFKFPSLFSLLEYTC